MATDSDAPPWAGKVGADFRAWYASASTEERRAYRDWIGLQAGASGWAVACLEWAISYEALAACVDHAPGGEEP